MTDPVTQKTDENSENKSDYKFRLPTPETIAQEEVFNNCFVRSVVSCVMGAGLGIVFGIFAASMEGSTGGGFTPDLSVPENKRARDVFIDMVKSTKTKSVSYAKGFAAMGSIFAGSECVIEKWRAKHDMYNSAYAGCFTGGVLAHGAGLKMMCVGCASFAAFSVAIERFLQ